MEKGDIITSDRTKHPIIFLKSINSDQFVGNLITHSPTSDYPDNIGLQKEHFHNNEHYKVKFDNSYFVRISTIKMNDWGPFDKAGKLTEEGIKFVEKYLKEKKAILWKEYLKRNGSEEE